MKTIKTNFLTIAAITLAVLAMAGITMLVFNTKALAAIGPASSGSKLRAALPSLPEAGCTDDSSTVTCELWALPGTLVMPDGNIVPVWGFADNPAGPAQTPGPVIRVDLGRTLVIVLHNELPGETVSLAFPGQEGIIPDLDGVPTGNSKTYTFLANRAGTFLYEAGLTSGGARQVLMGLAGPLVVGSGAGDEEVLLVFSEIDPAFNAFPTGFSMLQYRTKYWLINGQAFPDTGYIDVTAGSTVLFRYLNAGSQTHPIGLLGLDQKVIASDGLDLAYPKKVNSASIASGQTLETLVEIPIAQNGTLYPLYNTSLYHHNNNQRLSDGRVAFGGILVFLQVTGNGEPTPLGPLASGVSLTPSKTNGFEDVLLTATFTDDDADVVGFEYFIDSLGPNGSGTWVEVLEPAQSVTVSTTIAQAILEALSGGQHTFYVRGLDALGNWGSTGSAVLTLDKAGPIILGLGLTPNPTNGNSNVIISGTADDRTTGYSIIVDAQYRLDGGDWQPMSFSPAGSPYAGLSATIPAANLAGLVEGIHPVEVRAEDELGNWSDPYGLAELKLDKTGPNVVAISLVPDLIDLSQPLPTTVRLEASLTDPVSGGILSKIVNAEGFIDTVGSPGTGFALYPSDGVFDESDEDVHYNIPGSYFATLPPGEHFILVVGKDQAGNWGPAGAALITIVAQVPDTTGPTVTNIVATPNPTNGANTVLLTATATDTQSNIAGAVWFEGLTPPRKLNYMTASDGSFDSLSENVKATIKVNSWKVGTYPISVRAYDAAGNWGDIVTIYLEVTK
jgi:hypothetical protein